LKLKSLRKGLPAVQTFGEPFKPLEFDESNEPKPDEAPTEGKVEENMEKVKPPTTDEYQWQWKVCWE
jgi:ribosome production factor 1